jgi:hypothetical protein
MSFKPFVLGAIALAALALGGCQIGGTTITPPTAAEVSAAVATACAYVPAVTSVEVVLNANPSITSATQLANVICTAVIQSGVLPKGHLGVAVEKDVTIVVNGKQYVIKGQTV